MAARKYAEMDAQNVNVINKVLREVFINVGGFWRSLTGSCFCSRSGDIFC